VKSPKEEGLFPADLNLGMIEEGLAREAMAGKAFNPTKDTSHEGEASSSSNKPNDCASRHLLKGVGPRKRPFTLERQGRGGKVRNS